MTNTHIAETLANLAADPVASFQEETTERRYLVGNAPAVRNWDRKFPIVPDRLVINLRDGWVTSVVASGPSIRRNGEFGAKHDFLFSNYYHYTDKAPEWIEALITSEGLQWKSGAR